MMVQVAACPACSEEFDLGAAIDEATKRQVSCPRCKRAYEFQREAPLGFQTWYNRADRYVLQVRLELAKREQPATQRGVSG